MIGFTKIQSVIYHFAAIFHKSTEATTATSDVGVMSGMHDIGI